MQKALISLLILAILSIFTGCGNNHNDSGPFIKTKVFKESKLQTITGFGSHLVLEQGEDFVLHGELTEQFAKLGNDTTVKIYAVDMKNIISKRRKILLDEIYLSGIKENPFFLSYLNAPDKKGEYEIVLCTKKDNITFFDSSKREHCSTNVIFSKKLTITVQ